MFVEYTKRNHGGLCCVQGKFLSEPHELGSCGDGELEQKQFREGPLGNSCNSSATSHLSSEIPLASVSVRSPAAIPSKQGKLNGKSQTGSPSPYSGTLGIQSKPFRSVHSKSCTLPPTQNPLVKDDQTVQLAPGLPPLKLPPTVRVLSHSDTELRKIPSAHSCIAKTASKRSANNSILGCLAGQRK